MKTIKYLFAIAILASGLASCTSKQDELKQEYIEACADGDFDKARSAVQKLETIDSYKAEEGLQYVNDKEIYALLAKPSREADARIVYLYNTYDYNQLPSMTDVLEVAISTERDNLAEKLIKSGVELSSSTISAAVSAENEDLVDMILKKEPEYILEEGVADYYKEAKGQEALATMLKQLWASVPSNNQYKRNQITGVAKKFAIADFDKLIAEAAVADIEDQIKALYTIKVPTRPALGKVQSEHTGEIPDDYTRYKNEVEDFNNKCLSIINNALDSGLPKMATRVLDIMKPNLEWNDLGSWAIVDKSYEGSVYHAFQVSETRSEINEARRLISTYQKKD